MPPKGSKDYSTFEKEPGKGARTANETQRGFLQRRHHEGQPDQMKKWVLKKLGSQQEVLVECITGEIYRFLIGPLQPKIRTGGTNEVLSEWVWYRSPRDVFDDPKYRVRAPLYKQRFCDHAEGFMRVLFSSIFLEENDLSDANYGLTLSPQPPMQVDEVTYEQAKAQGTRSIPLPAPGAEDYGEFIKIDHGQSLNSLRIANTHSLKSMAPVKYYEPQIERNEGNGIDIRTKKDRDNIWISKRKYVMSPYFLDNIVLDFLIGHVTRDYIDDLKYKPSTLPLFDGRLLSLFDAIPAEQRYDVLERAKHRAIAKIVYTNDDVLLGIATYAAHLDLPLKVRDIMAKIFTNKDNFFKAIRTNLDFCVLSYFYRQDIQQDLTDSLARMTQKRNSMVQGSSERYGELHMLHATDTDTMNKIIVVGDRFYSNGLYDKIHQLLRSLCNMVATYNWKVKGTGGKMAKIENSIRTVPETVYHMVQSLARYQLSPNMRCYRALEEVIYYSCLAARKSSHWRSKETQDGYNVIAGKINELAGTEPVIQYLVNKYSNKNAERYLDYFELSGEINKLPRQVLRH